MGKRIGAARSRAGLSQESLADRAGLTRAFISRIENGLAPKVSVDTIWKICRALEINPALIISDEVSIEALKTLDLIKEALQKK